MSTRQMGKGGAPNRNGFNSRQLLCGDIGAQYGVRVAIEPLNTGETNLINTVAEGLELNRLVGHPNVGVLADFFHIFKSGESLAAVEAAGDVLLHAHIARAHDDRGIPAEPDDLAACRRWAAALRKGGYHGRLSLEAKYRPDFETAIRAARPALEIFYS